MEPWGEQSFLPQGDLLKDISAGDMWDMLAGDRNLQDRNCTWISNNIQVSLEEARGPDLCRSTLQAISLIRRVFGEIWLPWCNRLETSLPRKVSESRILVFYGLFLPAQCQGWWRELVMTFKQEEWRPVISRVPGRHYSALVTYTHDVLIRDEGSPLHPALAGNNRSPLTCCILLLSFFSNQDSSGIRQWFAHEAALGLFVPLFCVTGRSVFRSVVSHLRIRLLGGTSWRSKLICFSHRITSLSVFGAIRVTGFTHHTWWFGGIVYF